MGNSSLFGVKAAPPVDAAEPLRAEVDALQGATLLEFGTTWCGHCQLIQPMLAAALAPYPGLRHLKIADGKGRPLGRSFAVKLWPTLVFLREGRELSRLVRPTTDRAISEALQVLAAAPAS